MTEPSKTTVKGCTVDERYRVTMPIAAIRDPPIQVGEEYDITIADQMTSFRATIQDNGAPRFQIPRPVFQMASFDVEPGDQVAVTIFHGEDDG